MHSFRKVCIFWTWKKLGSKQNIFRCLFFYIEIENHNFFKISQNWTPDFGWNRTQTDHHRSEVLSTLCKYVCKICIKNVFPLDFQTIWVIFFRQNIKCWKVAKSCSNWSSSVRSVATLCKYFDKFWKNHTQNVFSSK